MRFDKDEMNPPSKNPVPDPDEPVSVLLMSFTAEDQVDLCQILAHPNWQLHGCAGCGQALAFLRRQQVPVVVCEGNHPDGNWRDLLNGTQELPLPPSVLVCSRLPDESLWAEVLNLGGCDVLVQPFEQDEVLRVAYMAWQNWKRRCTEHLRSTKARSSTAWAEGT
jgi:DNA-binding response OmpR family regulator